MNVSVDLDLTIKISGASKAQVNHACERFDNYYDVNGLVTMYPEEQDDGSFEIQTGWMGGNLPDVETVKEQFENWLKEEC